MDRRKDDDDSLFDSQFDWEDETVETRGPEPPAAPPPAGERPREPRTLATDLERLRERVPLPVLAAVGVLVVVVVVVIAVIAARGGDEEALEPVAPAPAPPVVVEPGEDPAAEPVAPAPPAATPAVSVPEEGTLRVGDEGAAVRALQRALVQLGFLSDEPDGVFGERTRAAVEAFQESEGLAVDGIAGPQTARAINRALGRAG